MNQKTPQLEIEGVRKGMNEIHTEFNDLRTLTLHLHKEHHLLKDSLIMMQGALLDLDVLIEDLQVQMNNIKKDLISIKNATET